MCRVSDKEYPSYCIILTQVSRYDATELERKLQGELFDKWHEKFKTSNFSGIRFDKIDQFIDSMQGTYECIYVCYLKLLGKYLMNV